MIERAWSLRGGRPHDQLAWRFDCATEAPAKQRSPGGLDSSALGFPASPAACS